MNKKGFTLIELLAVIIILGILMIIAIPSVTKYINDSRKNAYVDTAKEIIGSARNLVNSGNLEMYDTNATYYIPASMIGTENGQKSPYGDFEEAYVAVTYDGKGYNYYWISVDETGQGVKNITRLDKLDEDDIESDIKVSDITELVNNTGIGGRKIVNILQDSNTWNTVTKNAKKNVLDDGGEATAVILNAAETILETALEKEQLNQIPNTNIYIFKGANPDNYVKFNNENWRIIGIYDDQLKIIRVNDSGVPTAPSGYTSIAYNTSQPNPGWANSSLKESLNTTYYETLIEDAKNIIDENGSWNVGASESNIAALQSYTQVTTSGTMVGSTTHITPWIGKVGLLANYEFLYASSGNNCLTTSGLYYDENCGLATNDWLHQNSHSLTISPRIGNTDHVIYIHTNGYISGTFTTGTDNQAVPVVFIDSSIGLLSGDGESPSTAYVLVRAG